MIEINLIPDVKLALLKARRQRSMVISASILLSLIAAGVLVVLSVYLFAIQSVMEKVADDGISKESKKLMNIKDLSKTLTIQNQLNQITINQDDKKMTSRLFDIISVTVPEGENTVSIRRLAFNSEENKVEIEAEAPNGYEALEVFKKTIAQTTFRFNSNDEAQKPIKIAETISDGERTYGEDADGKKVLRFTVSFTYPDELFSTRSEDGKVVGPEKQRVTDSVKGVPTSLFGTGEDK